MGLLDNITEEHTAMLRSKGYDETLLCSPDRPGKLSHELRHQLNQALAEWLIDGEGEPYDFILKIDAFFNHNREHCVFGFHHEFDVDKAALRLKGLEIFSSGLCLSVPLKDGHLPHARDAHRILKKHMASRKIGKKHGESDNQRKQLWKSN